MQSNEIQIVTLDDFENQVIKNSKPVIVDFGAEWCGPCRQLKPKLEEAAHKNNGKWVLACVNVDEAEPELPHKLNVSSIPAVFLYIGGKQVSNFVGFSQVKLNEMIAKASQ